MKLKELFEAEERSILSVMGKQKDPFPRVFYCSYNQLTSLQGAPSVVKGGFVCANNKLTSLAGIHKIVKEIHGCADFNGNLIKSNVLGLMRIKGLTRVFLDNEQVENILNKYLKGDRDIIKCQSELLDAGLEEFAKL
jgi:hypothetical protein